VRSSAIFPTNKSFESGERVNRKNRTATPINIDENFRVSNSDGTGRLMCVFHWRTTALHSYFFLRCVSPGRAYRSVPRHRCRCISACDRVSAEYDRPRETRSKTTDTLPRLRLCRGAGAICAKFPPRANAIVYHARVYLWQFAFFLVAKIALKKSIHVSSYREIKILREKCDPLHH